MCRLNSKGEGESIRSIGGEKFQPTASLESALSARCRYIGARIRCLEERTKIGEGGEQKNMAQ